MGLFRKKKTSRSVASEKNTNKKLLGRSLPSSIDTEKPSSCVEIINAPNDVGHCSLLSGFSCYSLVTGTFSVQGVLLDSSPAMRATSPNSHTTSDESLGSFTDDEDCFGDNGKQTNHSSRLLDKAAAKLAPIKSPIKAVVSRMPSTVFMRAADLPSMQSSVAQSRQSFMELTDDELIDHVHKPSSTPPLPTIDHDPNESWIALDDGNGKRAPLAEAAMSALVKTGMDAAMNRQMWTANGPTAKLLKNGLWDKTVFASFDSIPVPIPHAKGAKGENDVLVWSGTFSHKYYGCDLPAIRCEAIVNMSPAALANLLVDSNRVKEYNKMSIGRDDIMVLHEDEKCVTKIIVGRSKPPMLGKILQLKSLLHMEELPGGGRQGGYVVVSRAVAHVDAAEAAGDPKVVHSEMLMGINIIRAVEGDPDRCILINLNHLRSPMVPMMMAKRLGLSAAVNFINDIRALC